MSGGHCYTIMCPPPFCLCFQCNVADVHVADGSALCLLSFPCIVCTVNNWCISRSQITYLWTSWRGFVVTYGCTGSISAHDSLGPKTTVVCVQDFPFYMLIGSVYLTVLRVYIFFITESQKNINFKNVCKLNFCLLKAFRHLCPHTISPLWCQQDVSCMWALILFLSLWMSFSQRY